MELIKSIIGTYFNLLVLVFPKVAGKQSFYFFCIPFKAKLKPKQQKFLNTATQKNLLVEKKTLKTYQWGTGPKTILFVHGWQSNSYRWKNYIDKIDKTKYRIIAFDAPGHGNSDGLFCNVPLYEKALNEVIKEYGKPDTLIAHSIGSFSSMYFMRKNKSEIKKYVSLATPFTALQFIEVLQSELNLSDKSITQLKLYFKNHVGKPPEYFSLDNFSPFIQSKSLIIHDKNDKMTSSNHSKKLHGLLSNSTLVITQGYDHRLKGETIVDKVYEFIKGE